MLRCPAPLCRVFPCHPVLFRLSPPFDHRASRANIRPSLPANQMVGTRRVSLEGGQTVSVPAGIKTVGALKRHLEESCSVVSGERQLRIWDPAGGGYAAEPDEQLLPEGSVRAYLQPTAGHPVPRTPGLSSAQLTPSTSVAPGLSAALSPGVPRMQMPPTPKLGTASSQPPPTPTTAAAPMPPPASLAAPRSSPAHHRSPAAPHPERKVPVAAALGGSARPSATAAGSWGGVVGAVQTATVSTGSRSAPRLPDEATRSLRPPRNAVFPPTVRDVPLQGFNQPASSLLEYPLARIELVTTDPRDVGWPKRVLSELLSVL